MATETNDKTTPPVGSAGPAGSRPRPPMGGPAGAGGPSRGPGTGAPSRGRGPGGFGRRPPPRRKVCRVCLERRGQVDWKAVNFLRNFVTDRGKILSGRATGTCSTCQRQLTRAIKRARTMALLPTSPI